MSRLPNIAILGTGSDVGKSIVAAAICRLLSDAGHEAAPFKSQNMSNNSGVTPEGLEMGRAQIVQAQAARVVPHTDMNPVLLKPTGDKRSQVVLNGAVLENQSAMDYHLKKDFYFQQACAAFDRLSSRYHPIVLEGAGSCAEVNLMATDIVNFRMAAYADARVILVADIHRGGVFAQIAGTMACLPSQYREMVAGFIINRFRGDIDLFRDGVEWIEQQTAKPVFGVLPWFSGFKIDAEDSVELETLPPVSKRDNHRPAIGVIRLPHISNFTDFHPLAAIQDIQTLFIQKPEDLKGFKAIIIPGSKNTRWDLDWMHKSGMARALLDFSDKGGHVLGICGGYQMLGQSVEDPSGLEGMPGTTHGIGLLPVTTRLAAPKTTTLSEFEYKSIKSEGYEIHMGSTTGNGVIPMTVVNSRNGRTCRDPEGCVAENGKAGGTYIHGFFDSPRVLAVWLDYIGISNLDIPDTDCLEQKQADYDRLKSHFAAYVDIPFLSRPAGKRLHSP